jgi:23S rRNA (cytosine1962-C5)-methyltransferase
MKPLTHWAIHPQQQLRLAGQTTGFYLDQRENRHRTAAYCAGARVLNAFGYTAAFAVYALAAGAQHVVNLDSSLPALQLGERNLALNGFDPDGQAEGVAGNVFDVLRGWRAHGQRFDVIILDPPKFAHSQQQVARAARAYKDINLLAMQLLRPGGTLITFSCSGLVSADLFQKIVFGASVDAGRDVQVVERLGQGPDHPVLLAFPEGEYLKGLICRVI